MDKKDKKNVKVANVFQDGMNLDISDLLIKDTMMRFGLNVRILNLEGSSYLVTNLEGTETSFTLSPGFVPVAAEEFGSVLYLLSWNATTEEFEAGSYPSPKPGGGVDPSPIYRPFNNLTSSPTITVGDVTKPFRTTAYNLVTFPVIKKLVIQPDYDKSVNLCFTVKNEPPRIINSKFSAISDVVGNLIMSETADRSGTANSNTYTSSSVAKETRLIVYSDKILKMLFNGLESGGKLKPGNYTYVFHYMTEDFNKTNVVGQSSVCQVAFGSTENTTRGGDELQETSLRVKITLTNVDTDFKYLKVYVLYSSGQESIFQQYLELNIPITITGSTMVFTHTGFEDVTEVDQSTIDRDLQTIDSANAGTQVGGFYFLGGIKTNNYDYTQFKASVANDFKFAFKKDNLPTGTRPGYADPLNVYNYMGYYGREAYPFGIVFIMPRQELSPVFPCKGVDINSTTLGGATHTYETPVGGNYKGVIRFPWSNHHPIYEGTDTSGDIKVKHLELDLSTVPQEIKDASLGFFIVRGERQPWLVTQGLVIPTLKAPPIDFLGTDTDVDVSYWNTFHAELDTPGVFKFLPSLDNMMEAYVRESRDDNSSEGDGDYDYQVVDANNALHDGYIPVFIRDDKWEVFYSKTTDTWARHWAMLSGDAFMDEATIFSKINDRKETGIMQIGKIRSRVKGLIDPVAQLGPWSDPTTKNGYWYDQDGHSLYSTPTIKKASNLKYVPGESFYGGGNFISRIQASVYAGQYDISPDREMFELVNLAYNSFIGIEMAEGSVGQLSDSSKGINNPVAGNTRITSFGDGLGSGNGMSAGKNYDNYNRQIYASFLINIYPSTSIFTIDDLYPSVDSIRYRQISQRYTWSDVPVSNKIQVYGGDCYIGKFHRKLYQSPDKEPSVTNANYLLRSNIAAGAMITWYQESKFNPALRQPQNAVSSEPEMRSFFPYQSNGDFNTYRQYRLQETTGHSKGYSELLPPKNHYTSPSLAPFIETEYFSRVTWSERHIPNAFRNGYRSFIEGNYRDYDSSMGRIVAMFNHKGSLLIVFEHGIGITSVEQRVLTGDDSAGPIFSSPDGILPTTIAYVSREIGCQNHLAVIQTPSGIYGVDSSRDKFWQMRDTFKVISDNTISSFLVSNPISNPRLGYDFENNEVLFTTNEYTLCYREGLERFTSFYSFRPDFYAKRNKEMHSFVGQQAHRHNRPVYTIYGENKDVILEYVVNTGVQLTKVLDFINIISNEVRPIKIEFFSYNQETQLVQTLDPSAMNQYCKVEAGVDPITEEERIPFRDRKYVVQVPVKSEYNPGSVDDKWKIEGRIRDKYIIVRLTYNTVLPLELASVVSSFRYSLS